MVVKVKPLISDRVKRLRDRVIKGRPRLSCERVKFLTQSYRETDGQPPVIRRARAFERILRGMTIFIDENPIVGTLTQYPAGAQPYPEFGCEWMTEEQAFQSHLGVIEMSEEDKKWLKEAVDYWRDKCIISKHQQLLAQRYGGKAIRDNMVRLGVTIDLADEPNLGRTCADYGKVLNEGLKQVVGEANQELEKLPLGSLEALRKRDFLIAVIISCNAVIQFAQRYSHLAREMAHKETNAERKKELERIAETCQWVPANPARNFYEALQSFWFTHLAIQMENCSAGYSPGRFSQYMYPFYKKGKEEGKLTDEVVIELLQLLFIKFTEIARFAQATLWSRIQGTMFQNISLGGLTPEGKDATNELDFLILETQKRVRVTQPTLSVLFHDKMSEEFLLKATEVVRTGIGMPAFFNNDLNIQRLLDHGASLEEARDHCIIGCVEAGFSHTGNPLCGGYLNMPKLLELVLHNGKDPVTGEQIGLQTGKAEEFASYNELREAFKKQLSYFLRLHIESEYVLLSLQAQFTPTPFCSALVDDCIKNGQDIREGGGRHSMHGGPPVGTIDLADSMAAIKKLVFEGKRITMRKLLEGLKKDFEGEEELRKMLLDAPKYGNDDDYVDLIARDCYDMYYEEHQKYTDCNGRIHRPPALSVTAHFPMGAAVGALPSGRKAGLPLADGSVSAEPGMDKSGPTSLLLSAIKAVDTVKYGSTLLNMKFHPSALGSPEGLRKLIAMIKTYVDLGGHHVQFNVVSSNILKDAQLHPENYRDLVVRVAGFSAFFIHLDAKVQDEIIKRTELTFNI